MISGKKVRVEVEAAKALIQWKATLADEVCQQASRLAAASSQPNVITLSQYRQAAKLALKSLSEAIRDGGDCNANPRAA